jgi:hypothetical protein
MLVDHILSTARDVLRVLGFENRARRDRERQRENIETEIESGLCDIGEDEEKKRVKYASCKSDLAEFYGDGSWIASCKA